MDDGVERDGEVLSGTRHMANAERGRSLCPVRACLGQVVTPSL